jgi:hypothetical protein
MNGLQAIIMIFLQAPRAVWSGRFDVDENSSVSGLPARVVGVLLLYVAVHAIVDVCILAVAGQDALPPLYLLLRFFALIGSIIVVAVICAACRKKRVQKVQKVRREQTEDDEPPRKGWDPRDRW